MIISALSRYERTVSMFSAPVWIGVYIAALAAMGPHGATAIMVLGLGARAVARLPTRSGR